MVVIVCYVTEVPVVPPELVFITLQESQEKILNLKLLFSVCDGKIV